MDYEALTEEGLDEQSQETDRIPRKVTDTTCFRGLGRRPQAGRKNKTIVHKFRNAPFRRGSGVNLKTNPKGYGLQGLTKNAPYTAPAMAANDLVKT